MQQTDKHQYRGWWITPLTDEDGKRTGLWSARARYREDPANLRGGWFDTVEAAHAHVDEETR